MNIRPHRQKRMQLFLVWRKAKCSRVALGQESSGFYILFIRSELETFPELAVIPTFRIYAVLSFVGTYKEVDEGKEKKWAKKKRDQKREKKKSEKKRTENAEREN